MIPLGVLGSAHKTAGGWTPASLSGLLAWWDASDTATITASGGAVSQWNDKSGNGYNLTQATSTNQPTTGAATQNGLNVLTFDGGDDVQASAIAQAQPFTIAAVWKDTGGSARWYASNGNLVQFATSVGIYAGTAFVAGPAYTAGTWAYSTHIYNGATSVARLNSVAGTAGNPGSSGMASTFFLGSRSGSFYLTGAIGEVVISAGALSGTDLSNLETYLKTRWGL